MTRQLRQFAWTRLLLTVWLLVSLAASAARADLETYLKKPEPKFTARCLPAMSSRWLMPAQASADFSYSADRK